MSEDDVGPSMTDPIWSHLYESSTTDSSDDTSVASTLNLPPVDPSETWVEVPLRRELTNQETWDLQHELEAAGIPARAWRRNGWLNLLVTRKFDMVPEVPERFLSQATKVSDQFFRGLPK